MTPIFIFSALLIISCLGTIFINDSLKASAFFCLAMLNTAIIFILNSAEFVAFTAVIIYTALSVITFMFIFITMNTQERTVKRKFIFPAFGIGFAFLLEMLLFTIPLLPKENECTLCNGFITLSARKAPIINNGTTENIALFLYDKLWFILILLAILILMIIISIVNISITDEKQKKE